MIKRYCDRCDAEITDANRAVAQPGVPRDSTRLATMLKFGVKNHVYSAGTPLDGPPDSTEPHTLVVACMVSLDGTPNVGDFCKYCIIDCVLTADDRPHTPTPQGGATPDRVFLTWVADRLVHVYGENECVDFVHKLRAIAQSLPVERNTPA
jgi:hypothetical protein